MTKNLNMPLAPQSGETYPVSKFDTVMQDILLKQAGRSVYLPGDPIWAASGFGGWAETCTIVAAPTVAKLNPDDLNEFMFSLTSVPFSAVDRTYRHGPDSDLPIPKLYFDEVLARIKRTIHSKVDQVLALRTDLNLNIPEQEQVTETLNRRTWLYVYPDPSSAEIAHKVMTGELEADLMTFSQYHLTAEQVESIKKQQRFNPLKKILGK
ncbi:MAG TPA: hypothetical protein PKU95_00525 [Candidatus Dojkabacteria bacterium]|nr:hypothetical protein [Candidatus Dojkabacteria bacterium]